MARAIVQYIILIFFFFHMILITPWIVYNYRVIGVIRGTLSPLMRKREPPRFYLERPGSIICIALECMSNDS